ncbi:hypothetical protein MKZ38_007954 [Zalerion maritima]|uniref:Serine/threonine-protein phosphatase 2A activator n=1 Tax=Zalerion maritima TaxID=339359 RepID=A0AAD5RI27_9PEZI|nr:hypothetical protein MKZ38_007954 [Zalerion maritima]
MPSTTDTNTNPPALPAQPLSSTASPPAAPAIPDLRSRLPKLEPRKRRQRAGGVEPTPETPSLPSPPQTATLLFTTPSRRILSKKDHNLFLSSQTYKLILAFVFGLSDSVTDVPSSALRDSEISDVVKAILTILDEAEDLVRQTPPEDQGGSRFGNKVFRTFLDKVLAKLPEWHKKLNVEGDAAAEAGTYLGQAFGNKTRIDYGSGHELNFAMWLLCLYQLGIIQTSDFKALVLRAFQRYLELMRTVQLTYYLEPAGSHGVWGLDDYQFLPFLFGASQLLHHPFITPRAIHQQLTIEEFGHDFMYLGQIQFVNNTKTVKDLRWHSPMLDDISASKNWAKIEGGMRKMFAAEVLGKLPVMQHFMFGSLVPAAQGMSIDMNEDGGESGEAEDTVHAGHQHDGDSCQSWGNCCGIKVPSSAAAVQEMRKRGQGDKLRRIPFD